jgi:hypothetical protein
MKEATVAYNVIRVAVGNVQGLHGPYHGLHGHVNILENQSDEIPPVVLGVAGAMNDPHLLDEGRFS